MQWSIECTAHLMKWEEHQELIMMIQGFRPI